MDNAKAGRAFTATTFQQQHQQPADWSKNKTKKEASRRATMEITDHTPNQPKQKPQTQQWSDCKQKLNKVGIYSGHDLS